VQFATPVPANELIEASWVARLPRRMVGAGGVRQPLLDPATRERSRARFPKPSPRTLNAGALIVSSGLLDAGIAWRRHVLLFPIPVHRPWWGRCRWDTHGRSAPETPVLSALCFAEARASAHWDQRGAGEAGTLGPIRENSGVYRRSSGRSYRSGRHGRGLMSWHAASARKRHAAREVRCWSASAWRALVRSSFIITGLPPSNRNLWRLARLPIEALLRIRSPRSGTRHVRAQSAGW